MTWFLVKLILTYLLCANIVAFAMMGIDKRKAKKDAYRIPEKSLFLAVIAGGGIGGVLGMKVFHHKTKHWYFKYGFPIICVLEYIIFIMLIFKIIF